MKIFLAAFELFLIFNLIPNTILQLIPSSRTCVTQGKFEIRDGTCQNYYICIFDGATFVSYDLRCATSLVFDPVAQFCRSPTEYICTQTPVSPACTGPGRFAITGTGCKMYYFCYWDGATYVRVDNLTCVNTLLFNPATHTCVLPTNFTCPA